MIRYVVKRQSVRWKGATYRKGELLPSNFTDRLRFRLLYPSRVGPVEIDEDDNIISVEPEGIADPGVEDIKGETGIPAIIVPPVVPVIKPAAVKAISGKATTITKV